MNLTFKAFSFRRVESPFDKDGKRSHIAVVEAQNLPKLDGWREVNPRDANLRSPVSRLIRQTIDEKPEMFLFLNRGLVLVVKSVRFNNDTNEVTLVMDDKEKHGLLDGGHTYSVIQEAMSGTTEGWEPLYLAVQIISGFEELDEVVDIVAARNTSRQVREDSILNLRNNFDSIREALAAQPYADKIAYKEFELGEENKPRPVSIRDVLSYLICFDVETFGEETHPHRAYHSKVGVERHFVNNQQRMERLAVLLPQILVLRDTIYQTMPEVYNKVGGEEGGAGKFGKLSGIKTKDKPTVPLHFVGDWSRYVIPGSYIYPVLAAFRTLVDKRPRSFGWLADPLDVYHAHKEKLIKRLGTQARQFQNANKLGKDASTWVACYDALEKALLRSRAGS